MAETPQSASGIVEFMISMKKLFGEFEFRVTTDKLIIPSKNWNIGPKHPANRPDSEFVIPSVNHNPEVKK